MAEQAAETGAGDPTSQLSNASNVLVLAPSFASTSDAVCADLLVGETANETSVLGITYRQSPTEWIDDWEAHAGGPPERGTVIGIGDRAGPAGPESLDAAVAESWSVETIENPADLTGLGIELSEFLDATRERSGAARPRVCYDSLTALMQYADLQRAFRFLHVVSGRVKSADTLAHYHLDPEAHDEQTLATVKGLFDAVLTLDESGDWSLATR
jgi:hypothetical protein